MMPSSSRGSISRSAVGLAALVVALGVAALALWYAPQRGSADAAPAAPRAAETHAAAALGPDTDAPEPADRHAALAGTARKRRVAGSVSFAAAHARTEHRAQLADIHVVARSMSGAELARASLDAERRFDLDASSVTDGVLIAIDHRFAFAPRPVLVPADASTSEPIDVPADVGACVTGVLRHAGTRALRATGDGTKGDTDAPAGDEPTASSPTRDAFEFATAWLIPAVADPNSPAAAQQLRRAAVDRDGRFEFRAVPTDSRWDVLIQHPECAPCASNALRLAPFEERVIAFELVTGRVLRLHVQDEAGRAIEGAELVLTDSGTGAGAAATASRAGLARATNSTSALGDCEFHGLGDVAYQVVARKPGYLTSTRAGLVPAPANDRAVIALTLSSGATLEGRVRWPDGRPAPRAALVLTKDPSQARMKVYRRVVRATSEADAEGHFRISGIEPARYDLEASSAADDPACAAGAAGFALRSALDASAADIELVLEPTLALSGRVLDPRGEPVRHFHVSAAARIPAPGLALPVRGRSVRREFEAADGAFTFTGLSAGEWLLDVEASGWAGVQARSVVLPQAVGETLEIRLVAPARARGTVLTAQGAPCAGARVLTESQDPARAAPRGTAPPSALADAHGRFELRELAPGEIALWAEAPGCAPSDRFVYTVLGGELREGVQLALRAGGTIRGFVYDAGGQPAVGEAVECSQFADVAFVRKTRTDAVGSFEFNALPPGPWDVVAALPAIARATEAGASSGADAESSVMKSVVLDAGAVLEIELGVPAREPVHVHGSVRVAGRPARCDVRLARLDASARGAVRAASTDADGHYELVVDAPGNYRAWIAPLEASASRGRATFDAVIAAAAEQRLDFDLPLGRIEGRVVDPHGAPVAAAIVVLRASVDEIGAAASAETALQTATDAQGRYAFDWLQPGSYGIAAHGPPQSDPALQLGAGVRDGVQLAANQALTDIDLELRTAGVLHVRVVGPNGPLAGARVYTRGSFDEPWLAAQPEFTDSQGIARLNGVARGRCCVSACTEQLASSEVEVDVRAADEPQIVELRVAAAGFLALSISAADARAARASVVIRDSSGRRVARPTSAQTTDAAAATNGSAYGLRCGPLPPDRYTIELSSAGREPLRTAVDVAANDDARVSIVLPQ